MKTNTGMSGMAALLLVAQLTAPLAPAQRSSSDDYRWPQPLAELKLHNGALILRPTHTAPPPVDRLVRDYNSHKFRDMAARQSERFFLHGLLPGAYRQYGEVMDRLSTNLAREVLRRGGVPASGRLYESGTRTFELMARTRPGGVGTLTRWETATFRVFHEGRFSTGLRWDRFERFAVPGLSGSAQRLYSRQVRLYQPTHPALRNTEIGLRWLNRATAAFGTGMKIAEGIKLFRDQVNLRASAIQIMNPSPFFREPPLAGNHVDRWVSSRAAAMAALVPREGLVRGYGSYSTGQGRLQYDSSIRVSGSGLRRGTISMNTWTLERTPTTRTETITRQTMPSMNAVERYALIRFPVGSYFDMNSSSTRTVRTTQTYRVSQMGGMSSFNVKPQPIYNPPVIQLPVYKPPPVYNPPAIKMPVYKPPVYNPPRR